MNLEKLIILVATDAIGMGLNMDINHIAFAKVNKFDGRSTSPLSISEMAQIAGRAGRYKRDGLLELLLSAEDFTQI
jgi:ATP-dependent RNA helicase SUPV3L1/SUV3